MKILSTLLEKYNTIQAPHATIIKTFITVVDELLDIQLSTEQVKVQKTTVVLQAPSVVKNEIRLHQTDILQRLSQELGNSETIRSIL